MPAMPPPVPRAASVSVIAGAGWSGSVPAAGVSAQSVDPATQVCSVGNVTTSPAAPSTGSSASTCTVARRASGSGVSAV